MTYETKQRIDFHLQRIANVLMLNANFIPTLGLLNGKMGITIFFYHYAKYTGNNVYETYAGELIDEICEGINTRIPIDFENGLTGIGWGIEYLAQNGFLEANTDEVLEDIDESVYQKILLQPTCRELVGLLLYQLARFKAKSRDSSSKELLKKHTLLCLLGECEKLLFFRNFKKQAAFLDLDTLKAVAFFLNEIDKIGLFPQESGRLLQYLPSYLEIANTQIETNSENISEDATKLAWNQLVYSSETNMENKNDKIFREAYEFAGSNENLSNYINNLKNKLGFKNGLTGIAIALLRNIPDFQLPIKKISGEKNEYKLSIFIFKSSVRGMQYGIGTYIRELTNALLSHSNIKIYLVNYYNKEHQEFNVETITKKYFIINIPSPSIQSFLKKDDDERYASIVVNFLRDIISKNKNVLFQINYIDGLPLVKELKKEYVYPVISVVHFAEWQQMFKGNQKKLKEYKNNLFSNSFIKHRFSCEKELYQLSNHIISVTKYMKDFLINEYGIDPSKIDVISNGINNVKCQSISEKEKVKLKHKLGFRSDEKIILFSGRIDPDKGIFFLLEAFTQASSYIDNLRLIMVGLGSIQDCLQKNHSYHGKITFTGFVSQEQIAQFYQIADIGIVPSIYDHCPYTILEMMAYKVPLIMSEVNGRNEILDETECVYLKPQIDVNGNITFDPIKIANAIISLLYDRSKVIALSKRYQRLVASKFSAKRMAKETLQVFKNCIPNDSGLVRRDIL